MRVDMATSQANDNSISYRGGLALQRVRIDL